MSRAVTEQIITQSRRLVELGVSKWLKLTHGKPTRSTKNEPLGFKYLLLFVSKLEVFRQLPPAYLENSGNSMVPCRDFLQLTQASSQVCLK